MIDIPRRDTGINRWLEPLLAALIAIGITRAIWHLSQYGYLPQPFYYDPYDIWMDWFNTAWWAHDPGMYDSWGTTYPPISFVFLKIASSPLCYRGEGPFAYGARDCDWIGVVALHGFYVVNIILAARIFLKIDRKTALPRSIALTMGLPMTGALERGNLLIPTFTAIMLAYGPLVRSARLRWLAAGIAVNFKVYLVAAIFPQLIRRRWRWFEGATIATVVVYIATFGMLGDGTPRQIFDNIVSYSTGGQSVTFLDAWFAATYSALLSLMNSNDVPITSIIGSQAVDVTVLVLPAALILTQLSIVAAAAAAWLRPEAVSMSRLTNLGVSLALITAESGGYTLAFTMYFTFMERWRGVGAKWAILACYLMSFPFDVAIDTVPPVVRDTYFGNRTVITDYALMLSPFLRPGFMMSIPLALSWMTIAEVWKDIRHQGWKNRWRFRRDAPIMVGKGHAVSPGIAGPIEMLENRTPSRLA